MQLKGEMKFKLFLKAFGLIINLHSPAAKAFVVQFTRKKMINKVRVFIRRKLSE